MKNNFLLVNLDEEKTKKLAEIISSTTSRKILNYLADKEATESELSKELKLPLSTVHYHLQKLVEGNLVVVEEFHYSKKGREVNHYKLANKYIIIAPKETKGLKSKLKSILPLIGIIAGISVIIEFVQRSTLSFGRVATLGAEKVIMGAADEAAETAFIAPTTVQSTLPLWAHIGFWFLIGGLATIVLYLIIDYFWKVKK
ncbi:MAG: helix-turn-helix domain-containing protein [Nanoarchaeota archaeon]|nr:helix-turn-helix domain-containing protein [Nanoarchaeota archaeon]